VDNNPYAAPQASVVENTALAELADFSPAYLRRLGWLSLISMIASLVLLLMALQHDALPGEGRQLADWLGLALMLLGNYLLLCLKGFAEARFAAAGLAWPVWLMVVSGLLLELLDFIFGAEMFSSFNLPGISYFAVMAAYGLATLWLGVRLLRVENVYPSLRLLAWLDITGGLLMASVVLVLLAIVPLLGSSMALAAVFFRGAQEQFSLAQAAQGSGPRPD
jgi:hypothetical protein